MQLVNRTASTRRNRKVTVLLLQKPEVEYGVGEMIGVSECVR